MKLLEMYFIAIILTLVYGHTHLIEPKGAVRKVDGDYCLKDSDKSVCCNKKKVGHPSASVWQRGQQIPITWPRNNHGGGFIALSVLPFADADKGYDGFNSNVFQFSCNEQGCMSGDTCSKKSLNSTAPCKDSFSGDSKARPKVCSQTFAVPTFLEDGEYTILWRWFGAGGWYGDESGSQGDYVSCIDFSVSGGPKESKQGCPVMKLGDVRDLNPTQCSYIGGGNKFDWCVKQGCKGDYVKGPPAGFEECAKAAVNVDSSSYIIDASYLDPSASASKVDSKKTFDKSSFVKVAPDLGMNDFTDVGKHDLTDGESAKTDIVVMQPTCTGSRFGFPCCLKPVTAPAVDPNGYNYGFENGVSCILA